MLGVCLREIERLSDPSGLIIGHWFFGKITVTRRKCILLPVVLFIFFEDMILHPPQLQSRDALTGWLCMQHNLVNKKIHKPLFDCSTALERWRYGWKDGSCNLPGMD